MQLTPLIVEFMHVINTNKILKSSRWELLLPIFVSGLSRPGFCYKNKRQRWLKERENVFPPVELHTPTRRRPSSKLKRERLAGMSQTQSSICRWIALFQCTCLDSLFENWSNHQFFLLWHTFSQQYTFSISLWFFFCQQSWFLKI